MGPGRLQRPFLTVKLKREDGLKVPRVGTGRSLATAASKDQGPREGAVCV
jgi:hypothetical protein